MANLEWFSFYPSTKVNNFGVAYSYHKGLLLDTMSSACGKMHGRKLFRFESMWTGAIGCEEVIASEWNSNTNEESVDDLK